MTKKLFLYFAVFLMTGISVGAQENDQMREAVLEDVTRSREGVVLALRSLDTIDRIHIVVGESEGWSISLALKNEKFARPLTHDLFKSFLDRNGWRVEKGGDSRHPRRGIPGRPRAGQGWDQGDL